MKLLQGWIEALEKLLKHLAPPVTPELDFPS
jgi:hypothetical protein